MSEHLSDLRLDAHRLGALDPRSEAHLLACAECQARALHLRRAAEAFAASFDPAALAAATPRPVRRRWVGWATGLLAAAAVALLVVRSSTDPIRTKGGGGGLRVERRGPNGPEPLKGPIEPGARLVVQASTSRPGYGRLYSATAGGPWLPLYPAPTAPAWRLEGPTWLDREVVIDDAPGRERLALVICPAPFSDPEGQAVLLHTGGPQGCLVETVTLEKR